MVESFVANRCPVRASALAYSNLLAIIPILAVVISVTSGLLKQEGQQRIEEFIQQFVNVITPDTKPMFGQLQNDPRILEARKEIAGRIQEFIQNTRSGTLGVTGTVALLFVGIGMLVRIENTFNDIWGIKEGRSWFSRVVHYWAAMTLGPLLLVSAIALTSSPHLQSIRDFLAGLPLSVGQTIQFGLRFLPFLILILAFTAFYKLMPNAYIDWQAAFMGGLLGGTLWQLNNQLSVFYASRIVTQSYIYGSLGLVPVIMIGLYFSWIILLFGAQVAYVAQNRRAFYQEKQTEILTQASREWVAVKVMTRSAAVFLQGGQPPTASEHSELLSVPSQWVSQVLRDLVETRLLIEVTHDSMTGYVPGRDVDAITLHDIRQAMRSGVTPLPELKEFETSLRKVQEQEREQSSRITLRQLLREAESPTGVSGSQPV